MVRACPNWRCVFWPILISLSVFTPQLALASIKEAPVLQDLMDASPILASLWPDPSQADDCTDFSGVSCEEDGPSVFSVVSINFRRIDLNFELPESLDGLTNLQTLKLHQCALTGAIPPLPSLTLLSSLDLGQNFLTGSIPPSLFHTSLTDIRLDANELTGDIPEEIGNAHNLIQVQFQYNSLTGSIPESIGNLKSMIILALFVNKLDGTVPESLSECTSLQILGIGDNLLTGPLPTNIGNLKAVSIIGADNNRLSGEIPASMNDLSELGELLLNRNQFSGDLPDLTGLTSAVTIKLSDNLLTGDVSQLMQLSFLQTLDFHNNFFSCPVPFELLDTFYPDTTIDSGLLCTANCTAGFESDPVLGCKECDVGYAKSMPSTDRCVLCSGSTYSNEAGATSCSPCPTGATCIGGSSFVIDPHYWSSEENPYVPRECIIKDHCKGNNVCQTNHTGPLCSTCDDGYFMSQSTCVECPETGKSVGFLMLGIFVIFAILMVLITLQYRSAARKGVATKALVVLLNCLQTIVIIGRLQARWPTTMQVAIEVADMASAPSALLSVDCLANETPLRPFYAKLLLYTLIPFATIVVAFTVSFCFYHYMLKKKKRQPKQARERAATLFSAIAMALLFLSYPKIAVQVLDLFSCRDVGSKSYLEADMSIECNDSFHIIRWGVGLPSLLVICFGIPFAGCYRLRRLSRKDGAFGRLANRRRLGMLYMGYSDEYYFWEIVIVSRKFILAFIVSVLSPLGPLVQVSLALVVSITYLTLHLLHQPFWTRSLNKLETMSLLVSTFFVWCCLYYVMDECDDQISVGIGLCASDETKVALTVLSIACLLGFASICITICIRALRSEGKLNWILDRMGLNAFISERDIKSKTAHDSPHIIGQTIDQMYQDTPNIRRATLTSAFEKVKDSPAEQLEETLQFVLDNGIRSRGNSFASSVASGKSPLYSDSSSSSGTVYNSSDDSDFERV